MVGPCKPERDELPEDIAPGRFVHLRTDAEDAELVVVPLRDALGGLSAQDVYEVYSAETLPGAVDAGERLACRVGGVPGLDRKSVV